MYNEKIFVSVIASTIYPHKCINLYKSLTLDNPIPTELILVGPQAVPLKKAQRYKFIKTPVKPSQCYEIASRAAQGEFLLPVADDLRFSKDFMKNLFKKVAETKDKKYLYVTRFKKNSNYTRRCKYRVDKYDRSSPKVGYVPLFKTSTWRQLGGLDRRFLTSHAVTDMQLRFFEQGYHIVGVKECSAIEMLEGEVNINTYVGPDKNMLKKLWKKDGKFHRNRRRDIKKFNDKNILKISQGNNDLPGYKKWR